MKKIYVLFLMCFLFLIPLVHGDIGPKPTIDIDFTYNDEKITDDVFYADLLECVNGLVLRHNIEEVIEQLDVSIFDEEKNCTWCPSSLTWGGECSDSKCHFNYFLPENFRLIVYVPSMDKVFISDEIERENFYSTYSANLLEDGSIEISETTNFFLTDSWEPIRNFTLALALTLIFEIITLLLIITIKKGEYRDKRSKLYLTVTGVNFISLPIIWFVITLTGLELLYIVVIGEVFAVVFEGLFIYYFNKDFLKLTTSMLLSLILNIVSLFIGGFVYLFLKLLLWF